jgi:hyperosmotically inducible protein
MALLVAGVGFIIPGCDRVDHEAREAAADVRGAAAHVGDRLADSWLTARVQARYFADDTVKGRFIEVSSRDGVVTLEGYVANEGELERALALAGETNGVERVDDQLRIGQEPQRVNAERSEEPAATMGAADPAFPQTPDTPAAALDDAMITSLIQAKYFVHDRIKVRHVEVDTKNGIVTLRGRVASDDERAAALLMARTTGGVQRVEDALTVDASLSPATRADDVVGTTGVREDDTALAASVKARLEEGNLATVDVSARDGIVLLQGDVPTDAARQRALAAAREAEGVLQVVDRLQIGR